MGMLGFCWVYRGFRVRRVFKGYRVVGVCRI